MLRTSFLALRRQLPTAEATGAAPPALLGALQALLQQQGTPAVPQQHLQSRAYAVPRRQGRSSPSAAAGAAGDVFDIDIVDAEPPPELRLPDLSALGGINPRLRDVMLQHQSLQKWVVGAVGLGCEQRGSKAAVANAACFTQDHACMPHMRVNAVCLHGRCTACSPA